MLHVVQCLLILEERLPALSPVARALLMSLRAKALMQGGRFLCF
jgi:hypothetical protein